MNKEKLLSIFTLPILWFIYLLFEFFTGRLNNINLFFGNILLIILFALIGLLIFTIKNKFPNGLRTKNLTLLVLLFFALDQGIKLLIKIFYFDKNICLIKEFLYYHPIINTTGSWLNARFHTGISFTILIILNIFALLMFIEIYRFILSKFSKSFWMDFSFLFIFCGALCSLVDKVFYGGSLDFIGIGNLFIADIKDIYINLGLLSFIVCIYVGGYLSSDDNTNLKDDFKGLIRFISFILSDIKSIFK